MFLHEEDSNVAASDDLYNEITEDRSSWMNVVVYEVLYMSAFVIGWFSFSWSSGSLLGMVAGCCSSNCRFYSPMMGPGSWVIPVMDFHHCGHIVDIVCVLKWVNIWADLLLGGLDALFPPEKTFSKVCPQPKVVCHPYMDPIDRRYVCFLVFSISQWK